MEPYAGTRVRQDILIQIVEHIKAKLEAIPHHLDYEGQKLAERIYFWILTISGVLGFGIGFYTQMVSHAIITIVAGSLLSCILVLPPWPFYRRHPLSWLPETKDSKGADKVSVSEKPAAPAKKQTKKDK